MDYKVNFANYQKAVDEILHDGPTKINNVLKSRSISPALSIDEIAELLKERIDDYEERGCHDRGFDDYKYYPAFIRDIGERIGRCIAHGIILADALIKEFSVRRADKIGRDLKVTSVKIVTGEFKRLVIQITYVASRLTFVVGVETSGGHGQQSVQTAINPLIEIDVRSTDPLFHFPPTIDPVLYSTVIDVEKEIKNLSNSLEIVINSQLE